jgi:hypothetical protein
MAARPELEKWRKLGGRILYTISSLFPNFGISSFFHIRMISKSVSFKWYLSRKERWVVNIECTKTAN